MDRVLNVLIVGVGGQGTIFAGKVLSRVAVLSGLDVKFSEIHGMAQRGGSVVTQVRVGPVVRAPVIDPGTADAVLAFERLEALRWAHMLRPDGLCIVSEHEIPPMTVLTGAASYPEDVSGTISAGSRVLAVDAHAMAECAGNARVSNVVLLGCLARRLDFDRSLWERALRETAPKRHLAANLRAFAMGWDRAGDDEMDTAEPAAGAGRVDA